MEIRFTITPEDKLSDEQIREIEAARNYVYEEDEDAPLIDPIATPELWEQALRALGDRNRRMAQRMA